MKKILSLFAVALFAMCSWADNVELFDATAKGQSTLETYLAPGWTVDAASTGSYNTTTGVITGHIENALSERWQGQLNLQTPLSNLGNGKKYNFSCDILTSTAVSNALVKVFDNTGSIDQAINTTAGTVYNFRKENVSLSGNGKIVFDFGFAPANTDITISNISIIELEEEPAEPTIYNRFPTGHLGIANFGDANGRIRLTLQKLSNTSVKVLVEPNNDGTIVDYVQVTFGNKTATIGERSASSTTNVGAITLNDVNTTVENTVNIMWHTPSMGAEGTWTTNNFTVQASELYVQTDEEAPVVSEVTATNVTYNKATITVLATDNVGIESYIVKNGETEVGTFTTASFVLTGLSAATRYSYTVFAKDIAGNISAGEDVTFTTAAMPEGTVLTSGEHSILVKAVHYTNIAVNNYVLTITSEEAIAGLGGSFWDPGAQELRSKGKLVDEHTYVVTTTASSDPQLYTPLYVLMPGEVNFGQTAFDWIEKNADAYTFAASDNDYYSLYLPYATTIPTNVTAYTGALNSENKSLTITAIEGNILPAETAVLVKVTGEEISAATTYSFEPSMESVTVANNDLKGVLAATQASVLEATTEENDVCLTLGIKNNVVGFYAPKASTIGANKVYLLVENSWFSSEAPALRIIEATDEATAVEDVEASEAVKFMENGQLFIKKNGVVYNAMGQIVK